MAYETGTALHANDLLDKIRVFAIAQGWTVNSWAARSDGGGSGGWCLNLAMDDLHVALFADLGAGTGDDPGQYIGGYLYPAWSAANGNMAQADASSRIYCNGLGSSQYVAYHFFGGAEHVHVVVETTTGTYKHLGFGRLRRLGAMTTGAYLYTSRWHYAIAYRWDVHSQNHGVPFNTHYAADPLGYSTVVRADSDGYSPRYLYSAANTNTHRILCGFSIQTERLPVRDLSASTLTGRAILWPVLVEARRGTSSLYSPIGQPPDFRWVRLNNLNPGDVLTLGTDEWMVFPVIRKNGGTGEVNSDTFGIAHKK